VIAYILIVLLSGGGKTIATVRFKDAESCDHAKKWVNLNDNSSMSVFAECFAEQSK
jgi:hypothetical protein